MIIVKVYNNNVVAARDRGAELILVGRGLGFGKRRGDEVDADAVEKRFHLSNTAAGAGARGILVDLPYGVIALTAAITEHLARTEHLVLEPAVEIGLADHLAAALRRLDEGITLTNNLLWETKATYPGEFAVALRVLQFIAERTGQVLPLDEAGFVAMHLVNAGLSGDMAETLVIMRALNEVLAIVQDELGVQIRQDSPHYVRFLTHVKFTLQRLSEDAQLSGRHEDMFRTQRDDDEAAYRCTLRIAARLEERFEVDVSQEERLYLMMHLSRLRERETG